MQRILACFRGGSNGVPRTLSSDEDAFAQRMREAQQQHRRSQLPLSGQRESISISRIREHQHQRAARQTEGAPHQLVYTRQFGQQDFQGRVGYGQRSYQAYQQPAVIMAEEELLRAISFGSEKLDVLRKGNEAGDEDAGECAICYDELHKAPVSVLCDARNHRVCRHFYHTKCCSLVEQSGIRCCPLCRQDFCRTMPVPSPLQNPRGWFQAVDADGSMDLDKSEVVDALTAVFPVDSKALAKNLDALWDTWDKTKSNSVTLPEFVDPDQGLLQWVVKNQVRLARQVGHGAVGIPDIRSDRQAWFSHWDADGNGELDKEEVMKALLKTFRDADVFAVRNMVEALWTDFDTDNGGTIDREEFLRSNIGLLDTVLANLYNECI